MVLVPCVDPKFVPAIVTVVPAAPEFGDTLVMPGGTGLPDTNVVTDDAESVIVKRPADTAIGACGARPSVAEVTHGVTVAAEVPLSSTPSGTLEPLSLMATIATVSVAGSL